MCQAPPQTSQLHFAEGAADGFHNLTWVIPLGDAELGCNPVPPTPKPMNDPSTTPCLSASWQKLLDVHLNGLAGKNVAQQVARATKGLCQSHHGQDPSQLKERR